VNCLLSYILHPNLLQQLPNLNLRLATAASVLSPDKFSPLEVEKLGNEKKGKKQKAETNYRTSLSRIQLLCRWDESEDQ
jgi:hypothetical protein